LINYIPVSKKRLHQTIKSGPNEHRTYPCPRMGSLNSFSNHQCKGQWLTLGQIKPPLQNPFTSFTLRGARSGWALPRFIHHPPTPRRVPSNNSPQITTRHLTDRSWDDG